MAESFERTHRANLVCMGVVPIQIDSIQNLPFVSVRSDSFVVRASSATQI
ncbi:hypothetical protein [Sulfitobacter sp. PR48]